MNKLEILAPAGSTESMKAAVRSGANAVYIGAKQFSARSAAKNFTYDELLQATQYCHARDVKVYLALNTLITDAELTEALEIAKKACALPIDAFIVQDVGLASLLQKAAPTVPLHGSTQMSVHSPAGAQLLFNNGFKRVVLSRELSKEEIKEIAASCPIEVEVFVHGALCMCVSGQCYLSSMLGGRSGNRGQCAQPCRLPFSADGKNNRYDLSLKDMSILEKLQALEAIGVTSAKIEGRMKRPEYVACAVQAAKQYLQTGSASQQAVNNLRSVFSRSGFTNGYYTGERKEMFGTRQKDDVTSATNKVLSQIAATYKDEQQTIPINFEFTSCIAQKIKLTASDNKNNTVTVYGDTAEIAINHPLDEAKINTQLQKTGGTPFYTANISCLIDINSSVPLSAINKLRRNALSFLEEKRSNRPPIPFTSIIISKIPHNAQKNMPLRAGFPDSNIPSEFKTCELVYVPLSTPINELERLSQAGFTVGITIPRGIFGNEPTIKKSLQKAKNAGITHALANNLGAIPLASELGFTVHGGTHLNTANTESLNFFEHLGLADVEVSFELTAEQINSLGGKIKRGVVIYGHLPLMLTRNCPAQNVGKKCSSCKGSAQLTDRKNITFPLKCENDCSTLFNSVPLYMGDKPFAFSTIDYKIINFTVENYVERVNILNKIRKKSDFQQPFTRGLYFRGLQI